MVSSSSQCICLLGKLKETALIENSPSPFWLSTTSLLRRYEWLQEAAETSKNWIKSGGGGTTRPLPRDGGAEELRGDPTVGPHPKVWTIDRE